MAKEKPGMMMYWEVFDVLESLLDGQAKIMLHAIRNYSQYGEVPDFGSDAVLSTLWLLVKPKIDADSERYDGMVLQRKFAAFKRDNPDYKGTFEVWKEQLSLSDDSERNRPITADNEREQPHPTTTPTATAKATPEAKATPTATAEAYPIEGKRDNVEMDKGCTLPSATSEQPQKSILSEFFPSSVDTDFEQKKQRELDKFQAYLNGGK